MKNEILLRDACGLVISFLVFPVAEYCDAAGNKLSQYYFMNGTLAKSTDFIGNFVYENGLPAYIVYDEGRVVYYNTNKTCFAEAYIKDHLGNIRVAFRLENGVLKVRQVDSYYPFGMNIKGLTSNYNTPQNLDS